MRDIPGCARSRQNRTKRTFRKVYTPPRVMWSSEDLSSDSDVPFHDTSPRPLEMGNTDLQQEDRQPTSLPRSGLADNDVPKSRHPQAQRDVSAVGDGHQSSPPDRQKAEGISVNPTESSVSTSDADDKSAAEKSSRERRLHPPLSNVVSPEQPDKNRTDEETQRRSEDGVRSFRAPASVIPAPSSAPSTALQYHRNSPGHPSCLNREANTPNQLSPDSHPDVPTGENHCPDVTSSSAGNDDTPDGKTLHPVPVQSPDRPEVVKRREEEGTGAREPAEGSWGGRLCWCVPLRFVVVWAVFVGMVIINAMRTNVGVTVLTILGKETLFSFNETTAKREVRDCCRSCWAGGSVGGDGSGTGGDGSSSSSSGSVW